MLFAMLGVSIAIGVGNMIFLAVIFQKLDAPKRGRRVS